MRITSIDFTRAVYAQETGVFPILLITIDHDLLSESILISTDPTERVEETASTLIYGTISNGSTYFFYPISITLPGDSDEGPSGMQMEIDNIGRDLVTIIRSLTSPPTIKVDIVLNTDVDTVLGSWPEFLLVNVKINANTIHGELMLETLIYEPYPAAVFNPSEFPGCF